MYSGKWTRVFVMFSITYWLKDVGAAEMTLENLQQMYKNNTPGYQICYFDGSFCPRGQEYCNVKERTCKSLFPKDASEETKLATCTEVIRTNETEPGVYDTCVYFFGELETRRVLRNHTEDHPQDTHPMRAPGKELCRHPDIFCQLGYEFCNITGGNCEPLFPHNASDTEKRQRCEQVIRNNMTILKDACIYALGNMRSSEFLGNHTDDHPQDTHPMRAPGKELCRHPDIFCQLGYEFCNITGGNCEPLFPHNASDKEKRQRCEQVIRNNMTMLRDTCIYALGNMRCSEFFGNHTEAHPQDTHLMRAPGKELCRHPDIFCQLGYEFCNITGGNCEPLFPHNASDKEKRQRCEQVIRNNMTMLRDTCIYALGNMRCSEFDVTDKKAEEQANGGNVWGIAITVILVIVIIVALIAFLVYIKRKKLWCFKETQTPPQRTQAPPAELQPMIAIDADDIRKREEGNRINSMSNDPNSDRN